MKAFNIFKRSVRIALLFLSGPTWAEDDPSQSGANGQDSEARADSSSSPHDPPKTKTPYQKANEAILSNLVNESEGVQCSIEDAMATFINHERRKKKPFPWKVAMEIGPNISINTVGYIQVISRIFLKCKCFIMCENEM